MPNFVILFPMLVFIPVIVLALVAAIVGLVHVVAAPRLYRAAARPARARAMPRHLGGGIQPLSSRMRVRAMPPMGLAANKT